MLTFGASQFIGGASPGYALFGGGNNASNTAGSPTTCIYAFVSNIVTSGNNLSGTYFDTAAAAGKNFGLFSGFNSGKTVQPVTKFTFSTKAFSIATSLVWASYPPSDTSGVGLGNAVYGYFFNGNSSPNSNGYAYLNLYNYSTDAVSSLSLGYGSGYFSGGCGNSVFGIFPEGSSSNGATHQITYATAVLSSPSVSFATNISAFLGAAGNSNVGIFVNYNAAYSFAWANSAIAAASALTYQSQIANVAAKIGAASNATQAVFGGGNNTSGTYLATTSIFNYASGATTSGTNLAYSATSLAAITSSNPGVI